MKKEFSIISLFSHGGPFVHECSAKFRSLFARFSWFFVKTTRNREVFAQNCDFCLFEYFSTFLVQKFCPGGNFQFSADFHEYTLSMTSYHVTEAINGYF